MFFIGFLGLHLGVTIIFFQTKEVSKFIKEDEKAKKEWS